jgi:hypothetical protein
MFRLIAIDFGYMFIFNITGIQSVFTERSTWVSNCKSFHRHCNTHLLLLLEFLSFLLGTPSMRYECHLD